MTNRRRSVTTRLVPAHTPEQLLALAQEYIRPLIGVIDQLNEADAEDELRVITKQLRLDPARHKLASCHPILAPNSWALQRTLLYSPF